MAECSSRRSIRRRVLLSLLAVTCVLPRAARGQNVGVGTGAINGTVTDSSGAVLPRVTIRLSSPALIGDQGTRVSATDAEGLYRFVALPPGEYVLEFRLDGFTTEV